jgi:hypothetical protein
MPKCNRIANAGNNLRAYGCPFDEVLGGNAGG